MDQRQYKYYCRDFEELPVRLDHLTIYLNFFEDRVEASNCLQMTAKEPLDAISLDANSLKIIKVEWCPNPAKPEEEARPLDYEYLEKQNKLIVKLPHKVREEEPFVVRTFTHCFPSDHLLEGIYRDVTPPGAPQQYMSQCQQWGFQRIMPIFDDCRAKCTMTTTLEGDAAYTHLISNGNIDRQSNPEGKPVPKPGDPSRQVITYRNPTPMAPYLFIACAGVWDVLADEVVYESGQTVRLEYLVPPGRKEGARIPMSILKEAVLWIEKTQDYLYTGDTYRTICMSKSNFGGMENVGNTTIVTDAALIDEHTLDTSLLYAHAVIVHEFEHNQCGSETTMETPFDVWLNEAYTVDVERRFMADMFDPAFIRLNQVDSIRNPLLGPLAMEDGGHVGRIVREAFNDPDELIDGVTYVKAAEVIRMLRLILGPKLFHKGKTLYFNRYRHGNANTDQFFQCFEEVSERSLEAFKREWLYRIGYPKVSAKAIYEPERRQYRLKFRQELETGQNPFHLPIEIALVDKKGQDIPGTRQVFELHEKEAERVFRNITEPPAFASMNRDYSFYGTFSQEDLSTETLILQAKLDPNVYNRIDAMRRLTDSERIKLLLNPDEEIGSEWLNLFGEILSEQDIPPAIKAFFLRIDEQPLDRRYLTWYPELVLAREKLMQTVNKTYRDQLVELFNRLDTYRPLKTESPKEGIEDRLLKQILLDLIAIDDLPESRRLILDHYHAATTATDRVAALMALNRSSAPERLEVLEEVYEAWHTHLSGYANYLRIIPNGTREDVFDRIEVEKNRESFDIKQPTWSRALILPMATNNKMVWTDRGIQWVADTVIEFSSINTMVASRLLNTFQHVRRLKSPLQEKVESALEKIVGKVSHEANPTIHGQAGAYLGRH